jgi:hypothetical protein
MVNTCWSECILEVLGFYAEGKCSGQNHSMVIAPDLGARVVAPNITEREDLVNLKQI